MKKSEVGILLYEKCNVTGHYVTKEGKHVNQHFDKNKFITDATILKEVIPLIKTQIPEDTEVLAGNVPGGVVLVAATAMESDYNFVFIRKKTPKNGNLIEGSDVSGKKVCVVTDVVTSVDDVMLWCNELQKVGAIVDTVVCVVRRNAEAVELLEAKGITLKHVFTMNYLRQLAGE